MGRICTLGQDVLQHVSMHIGEAEVAAGVAVGELFVFEAELVENGGVEVVEVDAILDGGDAILVRSSRS